METMSLLQMSLSGAALIGAVILIRALALNRLPKRTFLVLWALAAARLLVPVSVPSVLSVWSLVRPSPEAPLSPADPVPDVSWTLPSAALPAQTASPAAPAPAAVGGEDVPVWTAVWLAGVCLCAAFFLIAYLRCRRAFHAAVPVEEETVRTWLSERPLGRRVRVCRCGADTGPVTCGIFHPVILLPENTDWGDPERVRYVLEHEMVHIRRLDGVFKLALAAAACIHWFNPLAWAMLVLANRDIELSCDEAVVRRFGMDRRAAYARTLIDLEERKSGLGPFASAFSKNNMEERIMSIMKLKKASLLAVVLAAVLVCCLGAAFTTSAAEKTEPPRPSVEDGSFTEAELDRLASLWFEGYGDLTIAEYQEKMWKDRDNPEDMELIERYGVDKASDADDPAEKADAFDRYMWYIYEPLTAEQWQTQSFSGANAKAYWTYTLTLQDRDMLVITYEQAHAKLRQALGGTTSKEQADKVAAGFSNDQMQVEIPFYARFEDVEPSEDKEAYTQFSNEAAQSWDSVLAPYVPLGLSYTFNDPDHDGNGLTMWFEGKEVRGIFDEEQGIWITEHSGSGFPDGAVELYTVYTDGTLTGLRLAAEEEQSSFTEMREQNTAALRSGGQEKREFPRATQEDYDGILALRELKLGEDHPLDPTVLAKSSRKADYSDLSLEDFNRKLLDWANANQDAWDRINCDVQWNDYGVDLTEDEKTFVAHTCRLSGTENGQMVRALYTGKAAEDPGFSSTLPTWQTVENNVTTAWCDLGYNLTYHVSDPAAVTVRERDACAASMMNEINCFWRDTPMDDLLTMTETEVVERFNCWAAECGTEHVSFCHVTGDHIHFDCLDERHHEETCRPAETYRPARHHAGHHSGHHC